jgi:hypothetical protein
MNQNETHSETEKTVQAVEAASKSIVGALLDLGSAWAAHGLHAGKFSLENSARALEKTAKVLENMAQEIEAKKKG